MTVKRINKHSDSAKSINTKKPQTIEWTINYNLYNKHYTLHCTVIFQEVNGSVNSPEQQNEHVKWHAHVEFVDKRLSCKVTESNG